MKYFKLLILLTIGVIFWGCSNPNQEYIDKVKERIKENAMGLELNYENIEFTWIDTLYVSEKLDSLNERYNEDLNIILEIQYNPRDLEPGNIFSKEYLTRDKLRKIRNWEKNKRGVPFNDYSDYYEFASSNRNESEWLTNLTLQVEQSDKLLSKYEELGEGNLELIENVLWYYERIDSFYSNRNPSDRWGLVGNQIAYLKELRSEIDSLKSLNPNGVIHYKAKNKFSITNPVFGNTRQEITDYLYFDANHDIIARESSLEFLQ